jgi:arsenate reductase-like glutaredoxin family protein
MSKQFIKSGELQLLNGGYLSNKEGNPVNNQEFYEAQLHAEYIITFATMARKKDFVGKKADSLDSLKQEVKNFLDNSKAISFVEKPKDVKRPTTDTLAKEALAFIDFQEKSNNSEKVNNFLQQFKILKEFEDYGLFFDDEQIVKLKNIYTLKEVIGAVSETIALLD